MSETSIWKASPPRWRLATDGTLDEVIRGGGFCVPALGS